MNRRRFLLTTLASAVAAPQAAESQQAGEDGLVASLARPGGNIMGMSILALEVSGKCLALLKETVPRLARVAVLWNGADPGTAAELRNTETAAKVLKLTVQPVAVRDVGDLLTITRHRPEAIVVFADPLTVTNAQQITGYATQQRLPLVSELARADQVIE